MKMNTLCRGSVLGLVMLGLGMSGASWAKVTPEEADKLGKQLTAYGAEKAGNADGSIPAFTGKWLGAPPNIGYKGRGTPYPDPYGHESPLFVITADNMEQYAGHLTEGAKAMFKRYPKTFRMPVYPSHRDFRHTSTVDQLAKQNATVAEMQDGGLSIKNLPGAVAFPIPKNGLEASWNQNSAGLTWTENARYDQASVFADGNIAWGQVDRRILASRNNPNASAAERSDIKNVYFQIATQAPARQKGEIVTGWSYWSYTAANPQQAFLYSPGTRRVRQLPNYGFDMPSGPGGLRTLDDDRLFNGSPERYDWKLVGKREIYIPYHNYKLDDRKVKYATLLTKNHINPDYMRYEKHRVWVVEAVLKPGVRHLYSKRVFYFDEDQWQIVLAENYDNQGKLWRFNMQATVYAFDADSYFPRVALYHDLLSGHYMADRLINETTKEPVLNAGDMKAEDFTPDAIRRIGN